MIRLYTEMCYAVLTILGVADLLDLSKRFPPQLWGAGAVLICSILMIYIVAVHKKQERR